MMPDHVTYRITISVREWGMSGYVEGKQIARGLEALRHAQGLLWHYCFA